MHPKTFAHRCFGTSYPSNTLEAANVLLKTSLYGIDLDIHMTVDGQIVIQHDAITPSGQKIRYTPYGEFEKPLPLLEQAFKLAKKCTDKIINLELKSIPIASDREFNADFAKRLVELVQTYELGDRLIYQSYDWHILFKVQSLTTSAIAPITSKAEEKEMRWPSTWLDYFTDFLGRPIPDDAYDETVISTILQHFGRSAIWSPDLRDLTPHSMELARKAGLKVYSWTVQNADDRRKAQELGLDVMFDNEPVYKQLS